MHQESARGLRAAAVRLGLVALWGDELPPTDDPVQSILTDAVALDDQLGIDAGLLVQGDGFSLTELLEALRAPDGRSRWRALPASVQARLRALVDVADLEEPVG